MVTSPISPSVLANSAPSIGEGSPTATAGETFGRLLNDFLSKTAAQQGQADQAITDLAAGNTENLHRVLLEVVKSELGLRMVLEVRNRLLESYQQVMQMQV